MGGLCSKRSAVDKSPSDSILNADCLRDENHSSDESTVKVKSESVALPAEKNNEKWLPRLPLSFSDRLMNTFGQNPSGTVDLQAPQLSRIHSQKSRSTKSKSAASVKAGSTKDICSRKELPGEHLIKACTGFHCSKSHLILMLITVLPRSLPCGAILLVSEVSSILGRAGTVGLGKAVEVLDNFGSSVSSLNLSSSFVPGSTAKGGKISILAFEVANTVVKGANLLRSLSEENLKHLKEVVLPSESVQLLISKDMDELLRIAASDKREELKVFSGEVVRFGNRCKDPQWHNLDRYFEMNNSEQTIQSQLKQNMETVMQQLMSMAQFTAELYHELHSLDRLDQDYRRKLQEEEILTYAQRGDNLQILKQELKSQKKHVKNLKKKSLWSRMLEEVMEKLVDVVDFLNVEIHNAFGSADGDKPVRRSIVTNQRLGSAGLALHYANVIIQIDTLASRPNSVPSNMRDSLYQGLPPSMKDALRMKLHSSHVDEEATAAQMKNEMDKTLRWLVPIANNTSKSHHGFGWVGEWATAGAEQNRKPADLIRIETLYHADKIKIESYMLELIVWLHHLVGRSGVANGGLRSPIKSPIRSPTSKSSSSAAPECALGAPSALLSHEDQEMLRVVNFKKLIPGISKSQEFDTMRSKLDKKHERLSKSSSHSPTTAGRKEFYHPLRRPSLVPIIDFEIDKVKALDVIDRVDTQTHDLTRQSRRH